MFLGNDTAFLVLAEHFSPNGSSYVIVLRSVEVISVGMLSTARFLLNSSFKVTGLRSFASHIGRGELDRSGLLYLIRGGQARSWKLALLVGNMQAKLLSITDMSAIHIVYILFSRSLAHRVCSKGNNR
jgi:hypothetical protein